MKMVAMIAHQASIQPQMKATVPKTSAFDALSTHTVQNQEEISHVRSVVMANTLTNRVVPQRAKHVQLAKSRQEPMGHAIVKDAQQVPSAVLECSLVVFVAKDCTPTLRRLSVRPVVLASTTITTFKILQLRAKAVLLEDIHLPLV